MSVNIECVLKFKKHGKIIIIAFATYGVCEWRKILLLINKYLSNTNFLNCVNVYKCYFQREFFYIITSFFFPVFDMCFTNV